MLACSEIENVERIAAQLQEAKKEADRSAGEAAAAVAAAQDAAERVTALAADLEHAKAEADSFALIAELEAAKVDADNAAAYWSNPADSEDCRIHCDGDIPQHLKCVSNDKPPKRSDIGKQVDLYTPPTLEPTRLKLPFDVEAARLNTESCSSPAELPITLALRSPASECSWGSGCYLVFEELNQGTLTATWSHTNPTFSPSISQFSVDL